MPIRWDPLLVRALAEELDERLAGARLRGVRLDPERRDLVLLFREASVVCRLHPERSMVLLRPPVAPAEGDHRLKARLRRVSAPPDERLLRFELVGDGRPVEVVVELIGNRTNALVVEGPERTIRHLLVGRRGGRRVGQPYREPDPTGREGADGALDLQRWLELLDEVPPPDRAAELTRRVAWTSPLNAGHFLEGPLEEGHAAWREAALGRGRRPTLHRTGRGLQPYPIRLRSDPGEQVETLLEAFDTAEAEESAPAVALVVPPFLLERLDAQIERAERRMTRLHAELDAREHPERLRALGDLVLARLKQIPPGADGAVLEGFDGEPVEVALDPTKPPHENAASFYDRAGRSERAGERIPGLIEEAKARRERLLELREAALRGDVQADAVRALLPASAGRTGGDDGATLPYRVYRSSGGLEIRVGRGAKHNDDLTFRHSAPDDVWLHARHTAGAHVILRWTGAGNPPARDLEQAGILAALHSKARTSGSVPVDWTRRKHVRKPRGSAPGSVVPDRVKTLFVRPDDRLLEELAVGE